LLIKRDDLLGGSLVTVYTDRLENVPENAKPPVDLRFDMFFYYDETAETLDRKPINTPRLPGVSGASVWQYEPRVTNKVWTPESAAKVIGVQKSFIHRGLHGGFFRATNWQAVAEILRRTDKELADTIEREIDGSVGTEAGTTPG
jgi:hypothetical protein